MVCTQAGSGRPILLEFLALNYAQPLMSAEPVPVGKLTNPTLYHSSFAEPVFAEESENPY
jgi:hypothetical protein